MGKGKKALKVTGIILGSLIGLIIILHIILNITFSIQLNNKIAELKAQGKPITIADIAPPSVPDEDNAAIAYNKAFALMESEEGKETTKSMRELKSYSNISEWTGKQKQEMAKLISSKEFQNIYELIEQGTRKTHCNFYREYEKGPDMLLPNLNTMRQVTRLLCVKALLEAESGKLTETFDTLLIGLKFSNHLKEEPVLITQLVRIACNQIIMECIKNIADSKGIPVEKAALIINELSTHADVEPFIKCMDAERVAFGGWAFEKILKSNPVELKNFFFTNPEVTPPFSMVILSFLGKPIIKKDFFCYLTLMSKMGDSFDISYYEYAKENLTEDIPRYCILTGNLIPAIDRVREVTARYQASVDICRTGLALKIYKAENGKYPENLKSLAPEFLKEVPVDPFSGEKLKYSRYIMGFKLYSIGPNMQDDYGTKKAEEKDDPAYEDYDIVWECES